MGSVVTEFPGDRSTPRSAAASNRHSESALSSNGVTSLLQPDGANDAAGPSVAGEHSAGPVARVGHLAIGSVDILSVEVETDSGPIAIYARDDGAVTIDAIGHDPATAQIDMRLRGDALQFTTRSIVRSRKPWRALKPPATGLRVGLPSGLTIRATTGAGSVDVRGLTGDIVIETASGAVDIDGPCRSLTIVTNSGAARLSHLAGSLSFRSATGQLDASWIRLPETGTIDIKTGRGDISLRLPPLARVQAQFITGPAAITNEFASASEAGIKLSVTSRASHISVTKAEGADIDSPVSDN